MATAPTTIGLLTPVKAALGEWLGAFHAQVYPDTPANAEWAARDVRKACIWVPNRMVDAAEDMLSSWRNRENLPGHKSTTALLPIVFMGMSTEWQVTSLDQGRELEQPVPIQFPSDPLKRVFKLKTMSVDTRCQIVVAATEAASAMSLCGQLCAWAKTSWRVMASHPYAPIGVTTQWPVTIIGNDLAGIPTPIGEQIKVLAIDLTVRAVLPMFYGPSGAEANDGQVPPGFPVLNDVDTMHDPTLGPPTGVEPREWHRYLYESSYPPAVILHPSQQSRLAP